MSSDNFRQSSHPAMKFMMETSHKFQRSSDTVGSCGNKFHPAFLSLGCAKGRCLLTLNAPTPARRDWK
jgi:hypothetical protein